MDTNVLCLIECPEFVSIRVNSWLPICGSSRLGCKSINNQLSTINFLVSPLDPRLLQCRNYRVVRSVRPVVQARLSAARPDAALPA